jgi:rare lipoprotein A (peptidoglycan hydrolase)
MRTRRTIRTWTAVAWWLLVFLLAPTLNTPASGEGKALQLMAANLPSKAPLALATPNPRLAPKPLKVWECMSSWYGEPFDGQVTANGETYDMYAQTAAHPSLPLGSMVRVVNLRTHRSLVVRINDRGPYVEGRELDVSYEVARRLGFAERGVARVQLQLLEVPSRATTPQPND